MSKEILAIARAEALAVALVPRDGSMDRAAADDAIRQAVRTHHGVLGCALALAAEYGAHPETAAHRMRWACAVVADLYGNGGPAMSSAA